MFREYSPYEITQATDKIYKHIIRDYNVRNQLESGDGTNNMPKDLRNAIFYHESFRDCKWLKTNEKTLHADLLLAGITQLVTLMVADKIHEHQYLRSLKPIIA